MIQKLQAHCWFAYLTNIQYNWKCSQSRQTVKTNGLSLARSVCIVLVRFRACSLAHRFYPTTVPYTHRSSTSSRTATAAIRPTVSMSFVWVQPTESMNVYYNTCTYRCIRTDIYIYPNEYTHLEHSVRKQHTAILVLEWKAINSMDAATASTAVTAALTFNRIVTQQPCNRTTCYYCFDAVRVYYCSRQTVLYYSIASISGHSIYCASTAFRLRFNFVATALRCFRAFAAVCSS